MCKRVCHPAVGEISDVEEADALNDEPDLRVFVHVLLVEHGLLGFKIGSGRAVETYAVLLQEPVGSSSSELCGQLGGTGKEQEHKRKGRLVVLMAAAQACVCEV